MAKKIFLSGILLCGILLGSSVAFAQTNVSGTISQNTTWTLLPTPPNNGSPYIVTGDVTVNSGVTLTIQPGVDVKFAGNFKITVNGTLNAAGTAAQNIRFTSNQTTPAPGDWKSITINGPTGNGSVLDFVTVEYGGNTDGANIYLEQSSPTITNSAIAFSSDFALTCHSFTGGACYPTFTNNTYTNNAKNSIRYFGDIYRSGTLRKAGAPYVVTGDILIKDYTSTVIWTIDAGVEMRFDAGKRINIGYLSSNQNGGLTVQGTASEPVIFTSNQPSPAPGDWPGIYLHRGPMTISHARLEYSDRGVYVLSSSSPHGTPTVQNSTLQNNNNGIYFEPSTGPNILNNTITNNSYGIYAGCNLSTGCNPMINFNSIHSNTAYNLYTHNYSEPATARINAVNNWWGSNDPNVFLATIHDYLDDNNFAAVDFAPFLDAPSGNPNTSWNNRLYGYYQNRTLNSAFSPYVAIRNVIIKPTYTLTMDPGVVVKFNSTFQLLVRGALNSAGSSGNMVRFTSNAATPVAGDWAGIRIEGQTPASTIDYTEIKYADTGLYVLNGSPPISNSSFQNNNTGLTLVGTSTSLITNNVFDNNINSGIQLLASNTIPQPRPVLHYNSFLNNAQYDLRTGLAGVNVNVSGVVIDAENNWWGTANPAQIPASIWDFFDDNWRPKIDFAPYLVTDPANSIAITNVSVTNASFNPVIAETSQINYSVDIDANVTIKIYDHATQSLVRTLLNAQPRLAGNHGEIWNGRNDAAQLLPPGAYSYIIEAANTSGKSGRYDPILIDTTPPVISNVTITPPVDFWPAKGERLEVHFDLSEPAFVTFGFGGPTLAPFQYSPQKPFVRTNNVMYWDGRRNNGTVFTVPSGPHTFRVESALTRLPENIIAIDTDITLDVPSLIADPYVIRPLHNETTKITYNINQAATVTVRILTQDGTQVLNILEQSVPKSAGTYILTWDGKTTAGETIAEEGDYRIRVEAVSANGTFVRDGNITIFF